MQLQPHLGASSTHGNGRFSKPGSAPFPEDEKWDTQKRVVLIGFLQYLGLKGAFVPKCAVCWQCG